VVDEGENGLKKMIFIYLAGIVLSYDMVMESYKSDHGSFDNSVTTINGNNMVQRTNTWSNYLYDSVMYVTKSVSNFAYYKMMLLALYKTYGMYKHLLLKYNMANMDVVEIICVEYICSSEVKYLNQLLHMKYITTDNDQKKYIDELHELFDF
jgi:hypothetical protein